MTTKSSKERFTNDVPVQAWHDCTRNIVVGRGADAIHAFNREIGAQDGLARGWNPDATPALKATEMIFLCDLNSRACHIILLYRLDFRPWRAATVGEVVVFSERRYAPDRTEKLQLATPRYYRDRVDLQPGIHDPDDGTLTKDASPWIVAFSGTKVEASLTFGSYDEPWVYCASHYGTNRELRRLKSEFDAKYGYSVATRIIDPNSFAAWLGVDFVLGFDKTKDVSLNPIEKIYFTLSHFAARFVEGYIPFGPVVHVYYGPVNYEDVSGRVDQQDQCFDPNAGPRACFTKKLSFADQNEYRFAVSTHGTPMSQTHHMAVSPNLHALTCAV